MFMCFVLLLVHVTYVLPRMYGRYVSTLVRIWIYAITQYWTVTLGLDPLMHTMLGETNQETEKSWKKSRYLDTSQCEAHEWE